MDSPQRNLANMPRIYPKDGTEHRGGRQNAVYKPCEGSFTDALVRLPSDEVVEALARNKIFVKQKGVCSWCGKTIGLRHGLLSRHKPLSDVVQKWTEDEQGREENEELELKYDDG